MAAPAGRLFPNTSGTPGAAGAQARFRHSEVELIDPEIVRTTEIRVRRRQLLPSVKVRLALSSLNELMFVMHLAHSTAAILILFHCVAHIN